MNTRSTLPFLAAAMAMAETASDYPIHPAPQSNSKGNTWSQGGRNRRNKTGSVSQVKIRKNRRRSFAAGNRRAFA